MKQNETYLAAAVVVFFIQKVVYTKSGSHEGH